MWLIDVKTYRLVQFQDERLAKGLYAILSHTWEDDELEFADLHRGAISHLSVRRKNGFAKIKHSCAQAALWDLKYMWIDTCCIDKTSSAELSHAINSMFRWYKNAKICYAYLSDLANLEEGSTQAKNYITSFTDDLSKCRWFTRGWTLQEMLANKQVMFFDSTWRSIGTKWMLSDLLHSITGIPEDVIQGRSTIQSCSISERMAWAANRYTTREEDSAYCLLGIFDINVPLLYGEGPKAFLRLQERILQKSMDFSLLAWKMRLPEERNVLLAPEVACFKDLENLTSTADFSDDGDHRFTGKGISIQLPIRLGENGGSTIYAALNCTSGTPSELMIPVLRLRRVSREYSKAPITYEVVREIGEKRLQPRRYWTTKDNETADGVAIRDIVILYQHATMTVYIDTSFDVQPEDSRLDWDPKLCELHLQPDRGSMSDPRFALDCSLKFRDSESGETLLLSIKYAGSSWDPPDLWLSNPDSQPRETPNPSIIANWSHPGGVSEFWATSWNSRGWDIPPGVHIVRIWKCERLFAGAPCLTRSEVGNLAPPEIARRRWLSLDLPLASAPKTEALFSNCDFELETFFDTVFSLFADAHPS